MKKLLVILVICLATALPLFAQETYTDAKTLLEAVVEKTGGEKWNEITSMKASSELFIDIPGNPIDGTVDLTFKFPGYQHVSALIMVPGNVIEQTVVITPEGGWMDNNGNMQDIPSSKLKNTYSPSAALNYLQLEDATFSLEDGEVDGNAAYVVTVTVDDESVVNYFDKETLFRVKQEAISAQGTSTTLFSDYKEVDGVWMAYKQVQSGGPYNQNMTMTSITFNEEVDDSIFEK